MWSRSTTRKVMTDSSERQVASERGTVEVDIITPGSGGGGGTSAAAANGITTPGGNRIPISAPRRESVEIDIGNLSTSGVDSNYVAGAGGGPNEELNITTSVIPPPQFSSTPIPGTNPPSRDTGSERLTTPQTPTASEPRTTTTSTSTSPPRPEMNGNSDYHSGSRSSGASSSSSSRRQRNGGGGGLFGINLDLNFDPSSWLVPSNVAQRGISSLSVLPDWVRHPVGMIPNRGSDNSSSQSNAGLREGGQSQQHHHHHHHHHHGSSGGGGAGTASRLVTHLHPSQSGGGAAGTNWNAPSFQTSSSNPSNMHHHHSHHSSSSSNVPLRTRHTVVNSMRPVDEDMDADYNPVSTIDIGATGRDNRGDAHSYVIDMDSPMGGWAEDDGPASSQRGASNLATSDAAHDNASNAAVGGDGARRSIGDLNLPVGGIPGPAQGIPGGGGLNPDGTPSMTDAATGANERTRAAEILRDAPETRAFINEISRYTTIRPFIVINFLKGVFDHGTSILAFLALVVTFSHANSMVKKEVSKQRKRNLLYLTMIVVNLMACVAFIYYVFNEMELYYALVFMPTHTDLTAFWSLMWAVGVTDYVAKFGTVFVKIIVVSLPGCILPFQKRGKFYLFIEYSSQIYRSFLPVYPWLFYLVSAYEGTARMFGLLLAGIYVIFKITDSVKRFKDWLKALEKLLSNVHYGTNPTTKQLDGAGTICPICHDNFANPTRLQCSHIFCEECVATWFDRERTCPMCRAKVVDDPTYRDGSTSQYIQLF